MTKSKEEKTSQKTNENIKPKYCDCLPNSNVIFYSGMIYPGLGDDWKAKIDEITNKKDKVIVIISTCGGDPNEAFRMMRYLQYQFQEITVIIMGECYSAGTLFVLGANNIYMSDNAQLGPLDVQIRKEDDIMRMSGECYRQALANLNRTASLIFLEQFVKLKNNPSFPISTATASRVASEITVGLLSPITSQIEPSKLGEVLRAQNIGATYGCRLMSEIYPEDHANKIVSQLACGYASHGTVIDRREAKKIGIFVKELNFKDEFGKYFKSIEQKSLRQASNPIFRILDDEYLQND